MFYMEGWKPLVEVLDLVSVALQNKYVAENRRDEVGLGTFDADVYAAAWLVCDKCTSGIIAPSGGVILLSSKLFTRNSETSQWGDYVCLTMGQIGSGYRRPWVDGLDVDPLDVDDRDPAPFVQPYFGSHVMIREGDELKALLKEISKASPKKGRSSGRPRARDDFADIFRQLFPSGHAGWTKQQVIDEVHKEGGPKVSLSTLARVIRAIGSVS